MHERTCAISLLAMVSMLPISGLAEDTEPISLDEMIDTGSQWVQDNVDPAVIDAASQWAEENIDEEVLKAFKEADKKTIEVFFRDLAGKFQGNTVVDIDKLKPVARTTQTLLETRPETQPYASWLKTREDYFDVAKELRARTPKPPVVAPPARPTPTVTAKPPTLNPSIELEQKIWKKTIGKRPPPRGSAGWVVRLKPIFTAQQVPGELVWLAEVESSFAPRARSPAGAAGLYQLMPGTAKQLGLSLFPRDQRLNPEKNAEAAARYLKALHNRFRDWPLALAAYNTGENRLHALMKKHKARTFEAVYPHLPAETQMYVPKINATLLSREGVSLANLGK